MGYNDSVHAYHVRNGDWLKAHRGIYRLADADPSDWDDLILWSLWSRNRQGIPQGVFCRETALAVHGVKPFDRTRIHLSVPENFRKNCVIPSCLSLYKETIYPGDVRHFQGFSATSLRKALDSTSEGNIIPKIMEEKDDHLSDRKVPGMENPRLTFLNLLRKGED